MSAPIVIGAPGEALLEFISDVSAQGHMRGTAIWSDSQALRGISDGLALLGWDALLVDPDDEPLSTAAMSHRAQIHGEPTFVLLLCEGDSQVGSIAFMVMRHLPDTSVVLVGPESDAAADRLACLQEDLGLCLSRADDVHQALAVCTHHSGAAHETRREAEGDRHG